VATLPVLANAGPDPLGVIDPTGAKDSTAGLNRLLAGAKDGDVIENTFTLRKEGQLFIPPGVTFHGGKLYKTQTVPWAVVPDFATNPNGVASRRLYDIQGGVAGEPASLVNPFGVDSKGNDLAHGTGNGGYDAYMEWPPLASGGRYDGKHLRARFGPTGPWRKSDVGKKIQVLVNGGEGATFARIITDVSDDGMAVYWDDPGDPPRDGNGDPVHENAGGTLLWCITQAGASWVLEFQPNKGWGRRVHADQSWGAMADAYSDAMKMNQKADVFVSDGATLSGVEVASSNTRWLEMIWNFPASEPLITEFHHGVATETAASVVRDCYIHHTWGDGEAGPGQLIGTTIKYTGRQGCTGHYDSKTIDGCIFDWHRHHAIDIEATNPVHGVTVKNTTFGGNGDALNPKPAVAVSSPIVGFMFENNHSAKADVTAGKISAPTNFIAAPAKLAGSAWVSVQGNVSEAPAPPPSKLDPLFAFGGIDVLAVRGNTGMTNGYVVQPWLRDDKSDRCTRISVSGNNGGPTCKGQVAP
jgi:hypothetical protein